MHMHGPAGATADLPPLSGGLAAKVWFSALGTLYRRNGGIIDLALQAMSSHADSGTIPIRLTQR